MFTVQPRSLPAQVLAQYQSVAFTSAAGTGFQRPELYSLSVRQ
ncbi:hypothetical protein [Vibrio fluvialis]|nr:hypothetical protein [Vibrio fluvialis]